MNDLFIPFEILNIILIKKATLLLEDHISKLDIDFDKFNQVLIERKAVVAGSLALWCFDNTFVPGDMDIFLFKGSDIPIEKDFKFKNRFYHKVLDCFNGSSEDIKVEKIPLANCFCQHDRGMDYNWKFYRGNKKIMDVVKFYSTLEDFLRTSSFIANDFYWNGKEWYIPTNNLFKFLITKKLTINKNFSIDFLQVYEPWLRFENLSQIENFVSHHIHYILHEIKRISPKTVIKDPIKYLGDKKLFCLEVYCMLKSLYRIFKYMSRGYRFTNFMTWYKNTYNSLPDLAYYENQIETGKVKLINGYELKLR